MSNDRQLLILEFHPGTSCQLRCRFCFGRGHEYHGAHDLMDKPRISEMIEAFERQGGMELIVSGGMEPLSRPDTAFKAIAEAGRAGLRVSLYTNGVSESLHVASEVRALMTAAHRIRVSLCAASSRVYDCIHRPVRGSRTFEQVIGGIECMLSNRRKTGGAKVGVCCLVTEENLSELEDIITLAGKIGIDFIDFRYDTLSADRVPDAILEAGDMLARRAARRESHLPVIDVGDYLLLRPSRRPRLCLSYQHKLVVDALGCIWTCCLMSQMTFRPSWARKGDLVHCQGSAAEIIKRAVSGEPMPHCAVCTPYERKYNWRRQSMIEAGAAVVDSRHCRRSAGIQPV